VAATGGSTPRTLGALWAAYGWGLPWATARRVSKQLTHRVGRIWRRGPVSSDTLEAEVYVQGGRFIPVQDVNGKECRRVLQTLQADLMILAGTPVIRAAILEVPRLGTLNVHQGMLPRFRGMNVIEWAVLEGYPPTISVHFVDAGLDTGDIIATEPVPVLTGDTLTTVRMRASVQQIDLLARTVSAALSGPLPRLPQHAKEGRQYFTMHPRLRAIAERRLKEPWQGVSKP
jgi:methionyl-tRNA formyltransferase